jgi:LysR family hydrogen peroxide-inducible transcriptional activator
MNVTLFERNRKNIIPTTIGKTALEQAIIILRNADQFTQQMQNYTNPNSGPLLVGAIPTIAPYFLPSFLPKLENIFADSMIQISEDTTDTVLQKIKNGKMDLGVIALPYDIQDLETKILFEENFVIASNTPLKPDFSIQDLSEKNLLLLRDGHCLKDHILKACQFPKEKQNSFFEAESLYTLLAMVNQGYGITLLPEMAARQNIAHLYPKIIITQFTNPVPTRQIGLVWRRSDIRRIGYLSIDFAL